MPELPEVQTVVEELLPRLKNKKIKDVRVLLPKMVALGPATLPNLRTVDGSTAQKFAKTLRGQTITSVSRRAKLIIIDLAGKYALLVHLKMTGQLIYRGKTELSTPVRLFNIPRYEPVRLPAKSTHVIIELTDGSKLFYNDFRQFGYLKLVTDKELPQVKELAAFGPEPLDKSFTLDALRAIIQRRPKSLVKPFLLDSNMIAGIGNIYSDEILFYAKIKPTRTLKSLKPQEVKLLHAGIKKILKDAVKRRGSSVGDFVRPSGEWGNYGKVHKVYGRAKQPCFDCGTIIKSLKFNGRTGSYCPTCQR